jgi:hypothetical protein
MATAMTTLLKLRVMIRIRTSILLMMMYKVSFCCFDIGVKVEKLMYMASLVPLLALLFIA